MKKNVALLLVLALSAACFIPAPMPIDAAPRTIIVPYDYPNIREAIGNATDGDTIIVKSGTYQEPQLIIDKTLALMSENPENTKIIFSPPVGPYGPLGTYGIDYPIKIQANNVTLSGFTITANGDRPPLLSIGGDVLATGNGTRIFGNIFETGVAAIGDQTYITNNTINDMSYTNLGSLSLYGSHQIVTNNTIWGIWIEKSEHDIISKNNVFGTHGSGDPIYGAGILLRSATMNQIIANTITTAGHCIIIDWYIGTSGLQTRKSDNNTFYHNNFVTNSTHVNQVGYGEGGYSANNIWNGNKEGNYWSNYTSKYPKATERDHSGIEDTPYVIDANNVDYYPLAAPFDIENNALVTPPPTPTPEPYSLSTTLIGSAIAVVAVVCLGLLVYFKKRRTIPH
jgi:nitrous oxidase accessory protein NosD